MTRGDQAGTSPSVHQSARPPAASASVASRMSKQRSRNTNAEVTLRRELHSRGFRFRVHRRLLPGVRREADIVFGPARVAVSVDGCFWHGCPEHGTWPKNNAAWWHDKIEKNRRRDRETDAALTAAGWLPVRVWEHEDPIEAAARIASLVTTRRPTKRVRPELSE